MEWTYTAISILVGILASILAVSVGWQLWTAISFDAVRGRVTKEIDALKEEARSLRSSIDKLHSQVDRENKIRWIYWHHWEEGGISEPAYSKANEERQRNNQIFFLLRALEQIAQLSDDSILPEMDRVWAQYMVAIVDNLHFLTIGWSIGYGGVDIALYDLGSVSHALGRMELFPMDSEPQFSQAREYIAKAIRSTRGR